jgi:hypothetical protein
MRSGVRFQVAGFRQRGTHLHTGAPQVEARNTKLDSLRGLGHSSFRRRRIPSFAVGAAATHLRQEP